MRLGLTLGLGAASARTEDTQGPAPSALPLLLIVAGQSNARADGTSAATPPAKYTDGSLGEVYSFVADGLSLAEIETGTFPAYDVTTNADPDSAGTAWGSEAEFVYRMRQGGDDRPVYVVKLAINGQNLHTQWHPDTPNDKFAYLEAKVTRARALVPCGFGAEVVIWNQGESDAAEDSPADAYAGNFADWLFALRTRVTASGQVIVQRLRPLGHATGGGVIDATAGWPRAWTIREAQIAAALADGNATAVSADFDPSNFGSIHPGADWIEGLGLRSYAAWRGTYAATYGAITDTASDAFAFTDQTDVETESVILSNAVLPTGYERRAAVTVSGGEWRSLNSLDDDSVVQDWTSGAGVLDPFQKLQLRVTSSADAETATDVEVTVGGVSETWTVTTATESIDYETETDAFTTQAVSNGGVTIAGAQKAALDAFYVAAKASTWWARIDRLYLRLADDVSSSLDLKSRSTTLEAYASNGALPYLWSSDWGWTPQSDFSAGLGLGIDPSADMAQNDASLLIWYSQLSSNSRGDFYDSEGGTGQTFGRFQDSGAAQARLNGASSLARSGLTTVAGMRGIVRPDAGTLRLHGPDGAEIGSGSPASAAPVATALYLGARPGGTMSDARFFGAAVGRALSTAELQDIAARADALQAAFAAP
ncbi:sialate O-acetylesterase [Wenxinia marina]|uniref:Sialate O-acetylesterase domain-containing protein n=1 Tax=Wenxinia marina DSM 24838 TaxID=1123501 RepID=A0A0D0P868_9RHOB|nr:sialate O-acetylesterase [Wenxinia marina]KIQ67766.1 hypothetical protein Wenmar_03726 [Wenxinia marina DSM 24838]GGL77414.1 hypothetical protein GCM10011392_34800 [Wenxinia marina]